MSPTYTLTSAIVNQVASIAEMLAHRAALYGQITPALRRKNRIRSIQASLAIENNTLTLEQVSAVIDGKHVLGLPREILEVQNAFATYEALPLWQATAMDDLLAAHSLMMRGLIASAGQLRSQGVGVFKGGKLVHLAPPSYEVPERLHSLLLWLKETDEHPLIASSVFHYEFEFIHPFADGNGRVGRLWQTLILSTWNPLLAWLPVESVVQKRQDSYYQALEQSDAEHNATPFTIFMLGAIRDALAESLASEIALRPMGG